MQGLFELPRSANRLQRITKLHIQRHGNRAKDSEVTYFIISKIIIELPVPFLFWPTTNIRLHPFNSQYVILCSNFGIFDINLGWTFTNMDRLSSKQQLRAVYAFILITYCMYLLVQMPRSFFCLLMQYKRRITR